MPGGPGYESTSPGNAPAGGTTPTGGTPPSFLQQALKFGSNPSETSSQGYLEKAINWVNGNAGQTDAELKAVQNNAYTDSYRAARAQGLSDTAAMARATEASNAAGPGVIAKYGPALGIATLGAQLTGATKPYTPNPQPLGEQWGTGSQTGQAYMDAHPETFGKWKGWTTPGAAPRAQNPVNNPGVQPLATASPYTIPSNAPSNYVAGSTIPQPYNSPYSVMPTRMYNVGGTVNDPNVSGGNMAPTMTNTFSGGGRAGYAAGGPPPSYPRRSGEISGRGTGTSDSIPAMLSDGEFVLTAKAVRNAGGGSRREGAKRMYKLMHMLERGGKVKGA
jgi:hypothetical protein